MSAALTICGPMHGTTYTGPLEDSIKLAHDPAAQLEEVDWSASPPPVQLNYLTETYVRHYYIVRGITVNLYVWDKATEQDIAAELKKLGLA